MKILKTLITVAAVSLTLPSAFAMTTSEQIELVDDIMDNGGYYPFGNSHQGTLAQSASTTSNLQASAGKRYTVAAVCDTDCSDIDIRVTDKYGDIVGEDADATDQAVIQFKANYSGNYTIKTTMFNCEANYCFYRTKSYVAQ